MGIGDYFDRLAADPPQIWSMGWVADYPGPNDFLGILLGTGSSNNYGHWSSAGVRRRDRRRPRGRRTRPRSAPAFDRAEAMSARGAGHPALLRRRVDARRDGLSGAGRQRPRASSGWPAWRGRTMIRRLGRVAAAGRHRPVVARHRRRDRSCRGPGDVRRAAGDLHVRQVDRLRAAGHRLPAASATSRASAAHPAARPDRSSPRSRRRRQRRPDAPLRPRPGQAATSFRTRRSSRRWRVTDSPMGEPGRAVDDAHATRTTRFNGSTLDGKLVRVHWYQGGDAFGKRALAIGDKAVADARDAPRRDRDGPDRLLHLCRPGQPSTPRSGPATRENVGGQAHAGYPDDVRAHHARRYRRSVGR